MWNQRQKVPSYCETLPTRADFFHRACAMSLRILWFGVCHFYDVRKDFGCFKLLHCDALLGQCICDLISGWALWCATIWSAERGRECHLTLLGRGHHYAFVSLPTRQWRINGASCSSKCYFPFTSKCLDLFRAASIPPPPWFLFMSLVIFVQLLSFSITS